MQRQIENAEAVVWPQSCLARMKEAFEADQSRQYPWGQAQSLEGCLVNTSHSLAHGKPINAGHIFNGCWPTVDTGSRLHNGLGWPETPVWSSDFPGVAPFCRSLHHNSILFPLVLVDAALEALPSPVAGLWRWPLAHTQTHPYTRHPKGIQAIHGTRDRSVYLLTYLLSNNHEARRSNDTNLPTHCTAIMP